MWIVHTDIHFVVVDNVYFEILLISKSAFFLHKQISESDHRILLPLKNRVHHETKLPEFNNKIPTRILKIINLN